MDIRSKNKREHVIKSSSSTLELRKLLAIENEVLIFLCYARCYNTYNNPYLYVSY